MNRLGRTLTATEKTYEKTRLHAGNIMKALRALELYASGLIPDEVAKYGWKSFSQTQAQKISGSHGLVGRVKKSRVLTHVKVTLIE